MNAKEAVAARIIELCQERQIVPNALATESGIPPSTLYSILGKKSRNPGIVTIKMLCDGLDITVEEFFTSPLFRELEQEIK